MAHGVSEPILSPEYNIVALDNKRYETQQGIVQYQNLATFQQKATIGDYTKDSDDLISALILNDFTGGGQVEIANESSDQGRYWWGNLYDRTPGSLMLPREVLRTERPTGGTPTLAAWGIGDLNGLFFGAFGLDICRWVEGTGSWLDTTVNLTNLPVGDSFPFAGIGSTVVKRFIPQGAFGYDVWNGAAITHSAAIQPVGFTIWDNKLIALDTTCGIQVSQDGVAWTLSTKLDASYQPRSIVTFYDQQGRPNVHIVTDRQIFAWDAENDLLFPVDVQFPSHPFNGLATAVHRNGLYTSVGLDVRLYTGSVTTPVGPVRDQGLPFAFRGHIVAMREELNGLYALIAGSPAAPAELGDTAPIDGKSQLENWDGYTSPSQAASCLMMYDDRGWHAVWINESLSANATNITISEVTSGAYGDSYRIWWGVGGYLYTQTLPTNSHNPRQGREAGTDTFDPTGFLISPWYDFNMKAFQKLLSHVQVDMENASPLTKLRLSYQTDYDPAWTILGEATSRDAYVFEFGELLSPAPDTDGLRGGQSVQRVRFLIEMTRDPANRFDTPIMDAMVIKYVKIPLKTLTFKFTVPLAFEGSKHGRTAETMKQELEDLASSPRFVTFAHGRKSVEGQPGGKVYRVLETRVEGNDEAGGKRTGVRSVTLITIPVRRPTVAGQLASSSV